MEKEQINEVLKITFNRIGILKSLERQSREDFVNFYVENFRKNLEMIIDGSNSDVTELSSLIGEGELDV